MSLTIKFPQGQVFVDEQLTAAGRTLRFENCVSVGENSSVCIYDGSDLAATLARGGAPTAYALFNAASVGNGSSRLTIYSPPTNSVNPMIYRRSYRQQIRTPGGSVGIRV